MRKHNINYNPKPNPIICKPKVYKYKILFFIIILCNLLSRSKSQNLDSLLIVYEKRELQKIDSIVDSYKSQKSLLFLNLLPNVTWQNRTVFSDDTAFNLSINLSNFANYFQVKHRNKIELERLKNNFLEKLETSIIKFRSMIDKLLEYEISAEANLKNEDLEEKYYYIKKKQYDKNEITLEQWLEIQRNYNLSKARSSITLDKLIRQKKEIAEQLLR